MDVDNPKAKEEKRRRNLKLFGVFLLLLSLFLFNRYFFSAAKVSVSDIRELKDLVIVSDLVKGKTKGKNSAHFIEFSCKDFGKKFAITHPVYFCSAVDAIMQDIKRGDTVSVGMLESNYFDAGGTSGYNLIVSLKAHGNEYCDLNCRNEVEQKNTKEGFVLSFVMGVLCVFFGFLKRDIKLWDQKINPEIVLIVVGAILSLILFDVFK